MKTRRRVTQQQLGPYIHCSVPKVLPVKAHPGVIRQWMRSGDLESLESVIVEGQGHKLLGEYSPDLKVRAFLKTVPAYLARIDMVHEAAAKGTLEDLKTLLKNTDNVFTKKRLEKISLSKDLSGTGLLHKAVYYEYKDIVSWLLSNFPNTVHTRDRDGRTALHYSGHCRDKEWMWTAVSQAGADTTLVDCQLHTPGYYMEHPQEAKLPTVPEALSAARFNNNNQDLVVKPANIRIWIHDRDLGRLQQVVWEGYGDKLRTETSQHPSVRQFLTAVPYIMGVIRDVHSASVKNDLILLQRRTADPVPKDIFLTKDLNGLTPLHKAAGLGHVQTVKAILSACPEAVSMTDREGRTPLHYAAVAKGSGATYDALLQHGALENQLDKRDKTPGYYIQNPKEIDSKVLTMIPEAPRTASIFPPSWDWALLRGNGEGEGEKQLPPPPASTNGDSAFEEMSQDSPTKLPPQSLASKIPLPIPSNEVEEKLSRPQTYDLDVDEGVEEDEEEKGYRPDSDEQEGHYEAEYAEVDPEFGLENRPVPVRRSSDVTTDSSGVAPVGGITEEQVQQIVAAGNIEQLAALVLAGEGETLARQRSSQPDVQMFINNVPIYMTKIQKVHKAMKEGNLQELQSALDRRKFAVARENTSPLRLTPLHVAVLYNRTPVLRFLASRFPETLQATDTHGRTPLHYAAAMKDNGNHYNTLLSLGADNTLLDKDGKTAQYYLEHPGILSGEQILAAYEGKNTSDKVIQLKNSSSSGKANEYTQLKNKDNTKVESLESKKNNFDTQPRRKENVEDEFSETKKENVDKPKNKENVDVEHLVSRKKNVETQPTRKENLDDAFLETDKTSFDTQPKKKETLDAESLELKKKIFDMQPRKKENIDDEFMELKTTNFDTQPKKEESLESIKTKFDSLSTKKENSDVQFMALMKKHFDKLQLEHSKNPSLLGELLTLDLFNRYGTLKTKSGFTLLDIIKPGLKQHSKKSSVISIESSPILLPDKDSFVIFKDLVVSVIKSLNRLPMIDPLVVHPNLLDHNSKSQFSSVDLDPFSKTVKSCTVEFSRNLKAFEFSHALSLQNLEKIELILLEYFSKLSKPNQTLPDSLQSFSAGRSGYFTLSEISEPTNEIYEILKKLNLLDPSLDLRKMQIKHWSCGRGVFFHPRLNFAAWINVQEHLKIVISTQGRHRGRIGEIYNIVSSLVFHLDETFEFETDKLLGYLTVNPQLVGNGFKFHAVLQLPLVGEDFSDLKQLCDVRDLLVEALEQSKEFHVMNRQTCGLTECESFQKFTNAVINFIGLERVKSKEESSKASKMLTNLFKKYINK